MRIFGGEWTISRNWQDRKSKRISRKTIALEMGNQMTALRFQTKDRDQASPAYLWSYTKEAKVVQTNIFKCHASSFFPPIFFHVLSINKKFEVN